MGQRYVNFADQWKMLQKLSTMIFIFISPEDLNDDAVSHSADLIIRSYHELLNDYQFVIFVASSLFCMEDILNRLRRLGCKTSACILNSFTYLFFRF